MRNIKYDTLDLLAMLVLDDGSENLWRDIALRPIEPTYLVEQRTMASEVEVLRVKIRQGLADEQVVGQHAFEHAPFPVDVLQDGTTVYFLEEVLDDIAVHAKHLCQHLRR